MVGMLNDTLQIGQVRKGAKRAGHFGHGSHLCLIHHDSFKNVNRLSGATVGCQRATANSIHGQIVGAIYLSIYLQRLLPKIRRRMDKRECTSITMVRSNISLRCCLKRRCALLKIYDENMTHSSTWFG